MIVQLSPTEAVNTLWVLTVYKDSSTGKAMVSVGRPGGSCGPERVESDYSFEETIARLNDAASVSH